MSEQYHDFVNHCNEEMGIILRCIARKFTAIDVYKHFKCVIVKHGNFVIKMILDKLGCRTDAQLVGIIYSDVIKNVVCPFTFNVAALQWPEAWSITSDDQKEMQILNRNDVMTGSFSYIIAQSTFDKVGEPHSFKCKASYAMDIDPNVHADDDKCYISENHHIDGNVHVQLYHLTPMDHANRVMSFRMTWFNDLFES